MAYCSTDMGPDCEEKGSLACDHPGCAARFFPRAWVSMHVALQEHANRRGWDCYIEGPTDYDRRDLCSKHVRRCARPTPRGVRLTGDPEIDLRCGRRVKVRIGDEWMCGTHANQARRPAYGEPGCP